MTPPSPNPTPKPKAAVISTKDVTQALLRHWVWVFLIAPIAAAGAAVGVWYVIVIPKYSATSIFHVSTRTPAVLSTTPESQVDFNTYRQAQGTLLKSRLVLNAALERKEVQALPIVRQQSDPVDWLDGLIVVDFRLGQEFMRVTLEGDEEASRVLLKAVTDVYLQEIVNKDRNGRLSRLEQLKTAYARYEDNLKKKRATVKELTVQMGSGDEKVIAMKQQFSQEQLQQSQRELLQIRSELRRLHLEMAVIDARGKSPDAGPSEALINDELDQDPVIRQQRDRVQILETLVEDTRRAAVAGTRPVALVRAQTELAAAREVLEASVKRAKPTAVTRIKERTARLLSTESQTIKHKFELAKALEKALSDEIEALTENAKSLNLGRVDLEAFNREINQTERITEQLAANIESLKVELDAPARVTLQEDVTVAPIDQTRKKMKYAGYAGGGVLALIGLSVVVLESRRRRVTSSEEVAHELGLELVGTVPQVQTRNRMRIWGQHDPIEQQTLLTEAVDATRVWFQHTSRRDGVQSIMVTSALSGEAKTSLSSHLSLSLARGGLKTLLIDGDMRRPSAHKALNLPPGRGLAELLRGDATIKELVRTTDLYGLSFLPAGHWTPASTQQLSTETWPRILNELKQEFDMIVVDSPPVLPVVDALLLGQQVDGVIMSALQSVSMIGPLNEARQRLSQLGIRILGVVVSGVKSEYYHYRYYYNYTRALKQA